jgi:hypothetical protein
MTFPTHVMAPQKSPPFMKPLADNEFDMAAVQNSFFQITDNAIMISEQCTWDFPL